MGLSLPHSHHCGRGVLPQALPLGLRKFLEAGGILGNCLHMTFRQREVGGCLLITVFILFLYSTKSKGGNGVRLQNREVRVS
jgi:hypothetical protein